MPVGENSLRRYPELARISGRPVASLNSFIVRSVVLTDEIVKEIGSLRQITSRWGFTSGCSLDPGLGFGRWNCIGVQVELLGLSSDCCASTDFLGTELQSIRQEIL